MASIYNRFKKKIFREKTEIRVVNLGEKLINSTVWNMAVRHVGLGYTPTNKRLLAFK